MWPRAFRNHFGNWSLLFGTISWLGYGINFFTFNPGFLILGIVTGFLGTAYGFLGLWAPPRLTGLVAGVLSGLGCCCSLQFLASIG